MNEITNVDSSTNTSSTQLDSPRSNPKTPRTETSSEVWSPKMQAFPPPLASFSPDEWIRVYIPKSYQPTYLSPSRFVLRVCKHDREFSILQGDMDAFYSITNFTISKRSKREIIGDEKLVKGALFAAFVKDLKAYSRVLVKAKHEGKEVVVFLPDHGFFCTVKIKQMWELEPRFKRLPFQAFTASLPINSPGLTDRWSNEAVKVFKEAVSRKVLLGRISSVSTDASAFLSISIVFSELLVAKSEEKFYQPREEDINDILRDRDKILATKSSSSSSPSSSSSFSLEMSYPPREEMGQSVRDQWQSTIDLMIDKCFAKRIKCAFR